MKHLALTIIAALISAASATAAVGEVRPTAAPDTLDFPQRLQDRNQNLLPDGGSSATVIRHGRGGDLIVPDSLFRPQHISKFYPRKRFLNKAMLDFGGGFTSGIGTYSDGTYSMGMAPQFQIGLTDWATPEHGWRLALQAGQLPLSIYEGALREWKEYNPARFGLSADYLFNITALASRSYAKPAPAEIMLVAGAEADALSYTNLDLQNKWTYGLGLHLGLRGVLNLSPITYLYLQPQVGIYKPGAFFSPTTTGGERYAINASLTAGIGLRRDASFAKEDHASDTLRSVRNSWFLDLAGGFAVHADQASTLGPDFGVAFGKWFDYTNGFRVRLNGGYFNNVDDDHLLSAQLGVDYIWNVSRFFAIRSGNLRAQQSPWSLKFMVGGGVAATVPTGFKLSLTPHAGVGLQVGVRTGGLTQFYLEPRLDVHSGNYILDVPSANNQSLDLIPSLRAGFSFNQSYATQCRRRERNRLFRTHPFQHYFFVQGAAGLVIPAHYTQVRFGEFLQLLEPMAKVSVGKWFTPEHGLRLYGEGGRIQVGTTLGAYEFIDLGAEYIWNITNSIGGGYREYRPFEAVLGVGVNTGALFKAGESFNPGFSADLQLHYNIDKRWSIFLEPQVRVYGKNFLPLNGNTIDPVASLMIGTQLRTVGYDWRIVCDSTDWARHGFMGLSAGVASTLSTQPTLGFIPRIYGGYWFTPVSGLRFGGSYHTLRFDAFEHTGRQRKLTVGADYIMDLSNLAYGYRERRFHVRPLVGFNAGAGWQSSSTSFQGDLHAGLQLAFSLKHGNEFYMEPQIAYLSGKAKATRLYHFQPAFYIGVQKNVGSLGRGFALMGADLREIRQSNAESYSWTTEGEWRNKWFFEMGGGLNMLWGGAAKQQMRQYAGFSGLAGVGRWFTAYSGARLRFIGDRLNMETSTGKEGFEMMGLGLDYTHSLTNTIWGYNPARHIDFNLNVGGRLMWQRGSSKVLPGFNVSMQPMVNIGRSCALYLQPEMTFYGQGALQPERSRSFNFTNTLSLGLLLHPQNYDLKAARLLYDENGGQCFFSIAAGGGMPLRNMFAMHDEWFLTGRFSYGHWFTPTSAWRANVQGWATPRDFHTRTRSGRMTLGADYLFDVTTLATSRMDQRPFNFRPLVGFNVGLAYMSNFDSRLHFQGDVHAGVQMGVNLSRRVELYLEPQISHVWSGYGEASRLTRVHPSVMAGLNYRLTSYAKEALQDEDFDPHHRMFFSMSAGTGFSSNNIFGGQRYFRFKMSVDADMNLGYWFNPLHGLRAGVGINSMHIGAEKFPNHQRNILTLHADYMLNVLSMFRSPDALSKRAELVAYIGPNYSFDFAPGQSTLSGLGGQVGFWAGVKVSPKLTLFLEPTIQVQSPKLYPKSSHPIDGTLRLLGGFKVAL